MDATRLAAGFAAITFAGIAGGYLYSSKNRKADITEEKEILSEKTSESTRPASVALNSSNSTPNGSPRTFSKSLPSEADILFFSILDSYSRTSPGLTSEDDKPKKKRRGRKSRPQSAKIPSNH